MDNDLVSIIIRYCGTLFHRFGQNAFIRQEWQCFPTMRTYHKTTRKIHTTHDNVSLGIFIQYVVDHELNTFNI